MAKEKKHIEMETGWDARESFVYELIYRKHLVLSSDDVNPKQWFETLSDFYCIASCVVRDTKNGKERHKKYKLRLDEIESLLYHVIFEGKRFTEKERQERKERAYKMMKDFFMDIHYILWIRGIYMPRYEKADPTKAMMNMEI